MLLCYVGYLFLLNIMYILPSLSHLTHIVDKNNIIKLLIIILSLKFNDTLTN